MLIDLQIHTIATPGHATWEPDALMRYAKQQGVDVVAVTDHNTTAQVGAALDAADRHGVRCIPAVELDTAFGDKLWHLLLYGIDPQSPAILALCRAVVERNARDAQEIADYFRQRGHALPSLAQIAERQPTVADVGHALVQDGVVPSQPGVEDEAAGTGWIMTHLRPFYRPVTVDEATAIAHQQGGLAVLAHPGRSKGLYAIPATPDDIAVMVKVGIDGIEALYAKHTPQQQHFYTELARTHNLLVTAGSDSHHPSDGLRPRAAADCAAFLAHVGIEV
jgi:predicted metal-dependent phosphoesterase TrpH